MNPVGFEYFIDWRQRLHRNLGRIAKSIDNPNIVIPDLSYVLKDLKARNCQNWSAVTTDPWVVEHVVR